MWFLGGTVSELRGMEGASKRKNWRDERQINLAAEMIGSGMDNKLQI